MHKITPYGSHVHAPFFQERPDSDAASLVGVVERRIDDICFQAKSYRDFQQSFLTITSQTIALITRQARELRAGDPELERLEKLQFTLALMLQKIDRAAEKEDKKARHNWALIEPLINEFEELTDMLLSGEGFQFWNRQTRDKFIDLCGLLSNFEIELERDFPIDSSREEIFRLRDNFNHILKKLTSEKKELHKLLTDSSSDYTDPVLEDLEKKAYRDNKKALSMAQEIVGLYLASLNTVISNWKAPLQPPSLYIYQEKPKVGPATFKVSSTFLRSEKPPTPTTASASTKDIKPHHLATETPTSTVYPSKPVRATPESTPRFLAPGPAIASSPHPSPLELPAPSIYLSKPVKAKTSTAAPAAERTYGPASGIKKNEALTRDTSTLKPIPVPGDGNCFFYSLAIHLNRQRDSRSLLTHEQLRIECAQYVLEHYETDHELQEYVSTAMFDTNQDRAHEASEVSETYFLLLSENNTLYSALEEQMRRTRRVDLKAQLEAQVDQVLFNIRELEEKLTQARLEASGENNLNEFTYMQSSAEDKFYVATPELYAASRLYGKNIHVIEEGRESVFFEAPLQPAEDLYFKFENKHYEPLILVEGY